MGLDQMQLDELAIRPNGFRPNGNVPIIPRVESQILLNFNPSQASISHE